jgi:hypothetical protein
MTFTGSFSTFRFSVFVLLVVDYRGRGRDFRELEFRVEDELFANGRVHYFGLGVFLRFDVGAGVRILGQEWGFLFVFVSS